MKQALYYMAFRPGSAAPPYLYFIDDVLVSPKKFLKKDILLFPADDFVLFEVAFCLACIP